MPRPETTMPDHSLPDMWEIADTGETRTDPS